MATTYDNVPSWPAGHKVTAAEALIVTNLLEAAGTNGGLYSTQIAFKAADQSLASSTTMTNDNDLVVALQANAIYCFRLPLVYVSAATPLIKIGFTVPVGSTLKWVSNALDSTVTASNAGIIDKASRSTATPTLGLNNANAMFAVIEGTVQTSTTAGNLQFQFAQAVSNATSATIKSASYLWVQRIS